jgi:hypothetical protein
MSLLTTSSAGRSGSTEALPADSPAGELGEEEEFVTMLAAIAITFCHEAIFAVKSL